MTIVRAEPIREVAVLSPNRELQFLQHDEATKDLFEEEWAKAFQKGEEKGERSGFERARKEMAPSLNLLQAIASRLLELKGRLLDQLKPEIIEFAIAICERIIRKELSQPEALVKLIQSLLGSASTAVQQDILHIHLAPDDLIMLEKQLNQIHYDRQQIKGIRFAADSLMRRGDCRIESKTSLLNHDISRELLDLQSKLLQRDK